MEAWAVRDTSIYPKVMEAKKNEIFGNPPLQTTWISCAPTWGPGLELWTDRSAWFSTPARVTVLEYENNIT